jgi:hypothetical protein
MRMHSRSIIRRGAILFSLSLAASLTLAGAAKTKDPPWIAKDWTQWSDDDCDAVLYKSPWGLKTNSGGYASTSGPKVSTNLELEVQFRSALPIRQALLRKQQLLNSYDRMKPDKKQAFDQVHIHDLDTASIVLLMVGNETSASVPPGDGTLSYTEPALPPTQAALRLSNGALIQPTDTSILGKISAYGNGTQYWFPRNISGKPLLSPTDSSVTIELGRPIFSYNKNTGKADQPGAFQDSGTGFTFKIAGMMYGGKLEY